MCIATFRPALERRVQKSRGSSSARCGLPRARANIRSGTNVVSGGHGYTQCWEVRRTTVHGKMGGGNLMSIPRFAGSFASRSRP
eukprot:5468317-Pyramimonas_sp.AAC.1